MYTVVCDVKASESELVRVGRWIRGMCVFPACWFEQKVALVLGSPTTRRLRRRFSTALGARLTAKNERQRGQIGPKLCLLEVVSCLNSDVAVGVLLSSQGLRIIESLETNGNTHGLFKGETETARLFHEAAKESITV